MRQADKDGFKKIVVTSSIATILHGENQGQDAVGRRFRIKVGPFPVCGCPLWYLISSLDWNPATKEEALDGTRDPMFVYAAAKTLAEKEVWKFASEHPDIDVATSE